jgi:hypothetical protein
MTAAVNASGSMLAYLNSGVEEPVRYSGIANAAVNYLVMPGVTASPSVFINYDDQFLNPTANSGAIFDIAYKNALLSSVLRTRFQSVQYLDNANVTASPLGLSPAFNFNRADVTWGTFLGNNWPVAPYTEVSAARLTYTDQQDAASLDRSADDYHAKAGIRITPSSFLFAELGWRVNWRDTDDNRITSYNSNFFDGNITWRPSPVFSISGSVERYIGEPSTNLGILSDVRSYSVRINYVPVVGVSLSAAGGWQAVSDIGSGVHYNYAYADAQIAWGFNSHTQFYTALHYQDYAIEGQYYDYNALRIMAGVRIIPDGQDLFHGESLEAMFSRLSTPPGAGGAEVTVSAGYSWFGLPDLKLVTIVGGPWFDQAVGQFSGDDGSIDGGRLDIHLSKFAEVALPAGYLVSLNASGFYAGYQGTAQSHCMYTATTDCVIVNLVSANSPQAENTGPFGNLNILTNRQAAYYGMAIDAKFAVADLGSLKDLTLPGIILPIKIGFAMRGLNESSHLVSVDPLVSVPATYKETLDTYYYGGFLGVEWKQPLSHGWSLLLDATGGLYLANTQYKGSYNGYSPAFGSGYVAESGAANGSLDKETFIGTLRLDIMRELGWGTLAIFGQGEYLSYVPRVVYNNNDPASFWSWPIAGNQVGTHLASSDALNFTSGLSVSWHLN